MTVGPWPPVLTVPSHFPEPAAGDHAAERREAVPRVMRAYAPGAPVVFDGGAGHTDPRLVLPHGGLVRVDGPARRTTVMYRAACPVRG